MKWSELLTRMDSVREKVEGNTLSLLVEYRVRLRALHGEQMAEEVPEGDEFANEIIQLIYPYYVPPPEPVIDPLLACVPDDTVARKMTDKPGTKRMLADSVAGASLIIQPRENPFVPQAPDLEEVTEEELAK